MFPSNRRTQVLIEPYKQLRFGVVFIILNLIFATAMLLVFGYYLWDVFGAISEYFKLDTEQSMMTGRKFLVPLTAGIVLFTLFIISTLYVSVRYTHQMYGPLVSIRRFVDEILAGKNPAPIKLRANDQLHDLVDRLNLLSDSLAISNSTQEALNRFTEDLLAGKEPQALRLKDSDPMKPLSVKLTRLTEMLKTKR